MNRYKTSDLVKFLKMQVRFLSNGLQVLPVLPDDLSFKFLIKRNAAQIRIRTYFQVNGRGAKDKKLHSN